MRRYWFPILGLLVAAIGCSRPAPVEEIAARPTATSTASPLEPTTTDWPWWRGAERDAVAVGDTPPIEWSEESNVLWKAPVPGRGHATPTIWGDHIFVATADEAEQTLELVSYNRATGEQQWRSVVHKGPLMHTHQKNSHASATPACDGKLVFCAFIFDDALWVSAVDMEGNKAWQTNVGPFSSQHGYGSSPVIYKSNVIVTSDNQGPGYLAAVDRASGEIAWRIARADSPNYATPVLLDVAGRQQLLLHGTSKVTSYDPDNGKLMWECYGPCEIAACTIVGQGDMVYASGGYPEKELLAIRADGSGDVSSSHIVWSSREGVTYVPSPLLAGDRLFVVNDQGVAYCYDAATGKTVWRERLGGGFSSSPTLVGGYILATSEAGKTYVFKAADEYELVAENQLGDSQFASPVACDGRLYMRTGDALYCIGSSAAEEPAATGG